MQPFTKWHCLSSTGAMKNPEKGGARMNLKKKLDPWGTQRNYLFKCIVPRVFVDIMTNFKLMFL